MKEDDKILPSTPGMISKNDSLANLRENIIQQSSPNSIKNNSNKSFSSQKYTKEKFLEGLFVKLAQMYKEKNYNNIETEVNQNEHLLFSKSRISFELLCLKIRADLKLLERSYTTLLVSSRDKFNMGELVQMCFNMKSTFNKILKITDKNNQYMFEKTIQLYGKFLFFLGKFSFYQDKNLKAMAYITVALNLFKVFFVRNGVAAEIKTYTIYIQLILFACNIMISDHNYNSANMYLNLLTKISIVAIKAIEKFKKTKGIFNFRYKNIDDNSGNNLYYNKRKCTTCNNDESSMLSDNKIDKIDKTDDKKEHKASELLQTYLGYDSMFINIESESGTDNALSDLKSAFLAKKNDTQTQKTKVNKYTDIIIRYLGYGFLMVGFICEKKGEELKALDTYRQALYLLNPEARNSALEYQRVIYRLIRYLRDDLINKIKDDRESLKRRKEYLELLAQEEYKKKMKSTRDKELELIASGLNANKDKFSQVQNKILQEILPEKIQGTIEKLDNELTNFVYNELYTISANQPTIKTKKMLCHFQIYNKLLTSKYREFVVKNKNLEFNNPSKEKENIDKIQKYSNDKSTIIAQHYTKKNVTRIQSYRSKREDKALKNLKKNIRNSSMTQKFVNSDFDSIFNLSNLGSTIPGRQSNKNFINKISPKNSNKKDIFDLTFRKNSKQRNVDDSFFNREAGLSNLKSNILGSSDRSSLPFCNVEQSNTQQKNEKNDKKKDRNKRTIEPFRKIKNNTFLENDFERKKLDKILMCKKYFDKFFALDNITSKELEFQKTMLKLKQNNAKLLYQTLNKELGLTIAQNNENIRKKFLIMNENAQSEMKREEKFIYDNLISPTNKPKKVYKFFGKVLRPNEAKKFEGMKLHYILRKVIDKYKDIKKNYIDDTVILNKRNADSMLELNDQVSLLNNRLENSKRKLKKIKLNQSYNK